jgi:hypothetical protein
MDLSLWGLYLNWENAYSYSRALFIYDMIPNSCMTYDGHAVFSPSRAFYSTNATHCHSCASHLFYWRWLVFINLSCISQHPNLFFCHWLYLLSLLCFSWAEPPRHVPTIEMVIRFLRPNGRFPDSLSFQRWVLKIFIGGLARRRGGDNLFLYRQGAKGEEYWQNETKIS